MPQQSDWKRIFLAALMSIGFGYLAFAAIMFVGGLVLFPVLIVFFATGKSGAAVYILSTVFSLVVAGAIIATSYFSLKSLGRRAWQSGLIALFLSPIILLLLLVAYGNQKPSGQVLLTGLFQQPSVTLPVLLIAGFAFGVLVLIGGVVVTVKAAKK